jgi:RNA polymerase sigma factor (TIGR02999 family)
LQAGEGSRIEDCLAQAEAQQREELLYELLSIEVWHRRAAGQDPVLEDYLHRFPADDVTVRRVFVQGDSPIRLVDTEKAPYWNGRGHSFAAAAEAMRRILIDRARRKWRTKDGGCRERMPLSDVGIAAEAPAEQLLALDEALDRLAAVDPVKAELVKLRYFAGLCEEEAAAALGISCATASRYWTYARAWLINALDEKSD